MANLSAKVTTEELPPAPAAIEGVSTSSVATAGWTKRGRTDQIVRSGSFAEFDLRLGSFDVRSYIAYSMNGFFSNDGKVAYTKRIVPDDAVKSSVALSDSASGAVLIGRVIADPIVTLSSTKYNIKIQIDAYTATTIDVTGDAGVAATYALSAIVANINAALNTVNVALNGACSLHTDAQGNKRIKFTSPTTGVASKVELTAPAATDGTKELLGYTGTKTVTGLAASGTRFTFDALGAGVWGDDIQIVISANPNFKTSTGDYEKFDVNVLEETDGDGNFSNREEYTEVVLDDDQSPAFIADFIGDRSRLISVDEGSGFGIPRTLASVLYTDEPLGQGNAVLTTFSGYLLNLPNRGTVTINTTIAVVGAVVGADNGTGGITGTGISAGTVNYKTGQISLTFTNAVTDGTLVTATYRSTAGTQVTINLTGGYDGTFPLTRADVTDPSLQSTKDGIYAFDDITDEVLNVIMPDFGGSLAVHTDLVAYAETRKDMFLILDPAQGLDPDNVIQYVRDDAAFNTSYAALYWPWVKVSDSLANGAPKVIPPSGLVAGVYARTDQVSNVSQAPAGMNRGKLNTTVGYERTVSESDRDTVYPNRINPLIAERRTGRAVWGARTLSLDKAWRYIQARRFFLATEKSIYVNSWWTVFETISTDLYSRIYTSVRSYLRGLLTQGYFPTKIEADAFKVVVDSSNNTSQEIDNGEVIIDVFLAVSKPGEFVRFRFRQKINSTGS